MPSAYPAIIIDVSNRQGWLCARFKFHKGLVAVFRGLPQRVWTEFDNKAWSFSPSQTAVRKVEGTGAHISVTKSALELWGRGGGKLRSVPLDEGSEDFQAALMTHEYRTLAKGKPLPEDFKTKTLPMVHQRETLECIYALKKFYLNWDVGTGKTWEFLVTVQLAAYELGRPAVALLVGPINKIPDYRNEIQKHIGPKGLFIDARGTPKKWSKALEKAKEAVYTDKFTCIFVCMNWESLAPRMKDTRIDIFDVYIEDESHCAKNPNSARGKIAMKLATQIDWVIRGSGTPAPQGPFDLWAQLQPLAPGLLPSTYVGHQKRYANMELVEVAQGRKAWKPIGWINLNELRDIFARVSYRATKEECLDLPEVVTERHYVEMTAEHRALYKEVRQDGVVLLGKNKQMISAHAATILLRAQQVCSGFVGLTDMEGKPTGESHTILNNEKLEYIVTELIPSLMAAKPGRQIVMWSYHRIAIAALIERVKKIKVNGRLLSVGTLWGDTPKEEKETISEDFAAHKFDILISNPQSGGTGMEFQTADVEIWESRNFRLLLREQGEGRLHRYGQKNKVTRIDVMFEDSIEDYVLESLEAKTKIQKLLRNNPDGLLRDALGL